MCLARLRVDQPAMEQRDLKHIKHRQLWGELEAERPREHDIHVQPALQLRKQVDCARDTVCVCVYVCMRVCVCVCV
jgi:hypothetical protein